VSREFRVRNSAKLFGLRDTMHCKSVTEVLLYRLPPMSVATCRKASTRAATPAGGSSGVIAIVTRPDQLRPSPVTAAKIRRNFRTYSTFARSAARFLSISGHRESLAWARSYTKPARLLMPGKRWRAIQLHWQRVAIRKMYASKPQTRLGSDATGQIWHA